MTEIQGFWMTNNLIDGATIYVTYIDIENALDSGIKLSYESLEYAI